MEFENLQIEVPTHDDPSQSQLFGIKIYVRFWFYPDFLNITITVPIVTCQLILN